jgi:hypothetical protein
MPSVIKLQRFHSRPVGPALPHLDGHRLARRASGNDRLTEIGTIAVTKLQRSHGRRLLIKPERAPVMSQVGAFTIVGLSLQVDRKAE